MTLSRKNGLAISFLHSTLYIKTPVAYDMWNYSPPAWKPGGSNRLLERGSGDLANRDAP